MLTLPVRHTQSPCSFAMHWHKCAPVQHPIGQPVVACSCMTPTWVYMDYCNPSLEAQSLCYHLQSETFTAVAAQDCA